MTDTIGPPYACSRCSEPAKVAIFGGGTGGKVNTPVLADACLACLIDVLDDVMDKHRSVWYSLRVAP